MPKENKNDKLSEILEKVQKPLDMWCTFLTRHKLLDKDHLPGKLDCPELRKALEVLEAVNLSPEEREVYNARLSWIRDEGAIFKKVFGEGEAKGEAKGIEKGKMERSVEMAKKLLAKNNMSIDEISELTELSKREIEELRDGKTNDESAKIRKL